MNDFKGTKGEWELDPHEATVVRSTNSDNGNIAECHAPNEMCDHIVYVSDGTHWEENEEIAKANAQLIVTAPELLDRLNSLVLSIKAHPDYQTGRNQEFVDYVNLGEETINKALGL